MGRRNEKYYFVSSLAKGLRVLELLAANEEMSASQMARLLDTSRAASHRFLTTLRDLGYVEKTAQGRFCLTFKVLSLGMQKLDSFEIRHTARPFMRELVLAYGETVNLGHWDGETVVQIDKINSTEILRLDLGLGAHAPAYCTGLGKAILAFLPDEELDAYLESVELAALTPKTITNAENMRSEAAKIRRLGFAVDDEELSIGLRCVAAPVFNHSSYPAYALSLSGPSQRMTKTKIRTIKTKLLSVCQRFSRQIGYQPTESVAP
jgi:DNA-binding IclR family transcriptional regulator